MGPWNHRNSEPALGKDPPPPEGACAEAQSAVVLPSVRKGLCNQRMRWVQDIVIAKLLGAAVVLPEAVITRQACHFRSTCYTAYEHTVPFEEVFDVASTTRLLMAQDICVLSLSAAAERFRRLSRRKLVSQFAFPLSTTELLSKSPIIKNAIAGRMWAVADNTTCCTVVVPSSPPAIGLLQSVNRAFLPALPIQFAARKVLHQFSTQAREERGVPIVIHWRAEEDMVKSQHALDPEAFVSGAVTSLAQAYGSATYGTDVGPISLLVLGGASSSQLQNIWATLRRQGQRQGLKLHSLRLHSKESLQPRTDWSASFGGHDDVVGLVDLEIARQANVFIGSPFSSFSVVAAAIRRMRNTTTIMVPADVTDRLAAIFALQFPYTQEQEDTEDPCTELSKLHLFRSRWRCPKSGLARPQRRPKSGLARPQRLPESGLARPQRPQCEALAGSALHVEPPVDAPSRLGFTCTHAIVTAVYGGYDSLPVYSEIFRSSLASMELRRGFRTCWFAFTDQEFIDSVVLNDTISRAESAAKAEQSEQRPWFQVPPWQIVVLPTPTGWGEWDSNVIRSRLPKMLAHCVLRHAIKMLYVDAKVKLSRPENLWAMMELEGSLNISVNHNMTAPAAWVSPMHPVRRTVRDELICLYMSGKVTQSAFAQLRAYEAEGFPSTVAASMGGPGLSEGEWHTRDLRSPEAAAIGEAWFAEYWRWRRHSLRDQMSLDYVIWHLGLLPSQTIGTDRQGFAHVDARWLVRLVSSPPDKNKCNWKCYLLKNPDILSDILDAISKRGGNWLEKAKRHFKQHGQKEGRDCTCLGLRVPPDVALFGRVSHVKSRNNTATEDAFKEQLFSLNQFDSDDRWALLNANDHQWCHYPAFGLRNLETLVNLSRLLSHDP